MFTFYSSIPFFVKVSMVRVKEAREWQRMVRILRWEPARRVRLFLQ
jgi:hypothetical protein